MRSDWKEIELGAITELITKGTTPSSVGFQFVEQGINFIKVESLSPQGYLLRDKVAKIELEAQKALKRSQLHENDILYSIAGFIGRVAFVDETFLPANTNQALAIIRLIEDDSISKEFVYRFLKSYLIQIQSRRYSIQLAQANFNLGDVAKLKIQLPPFTQQKKIADILSTCDRVIKQTEAAIRKYEAIKKGMMHDLFTRGIDVKTGQLRPSYAEAPELYKESELGWIPLEWEVRELDQVTTLITDGAHFSPVPQEVGLPIGNVKDMRPNGFDLDNCTRILPFTFRV